MDKPVLILLTDNDNSTMLVAAPNMEAAEEVGAAAVFSHGGVSAWLIPPNAVTDVERVKDLLRDGKDVGTMHASDLGYGSPEPVRAFAGIGKVEVLTVRDPDADTTVNIFVDGQEFNGYAEESVDPGAGHMRSEWRAHTEEVRSNAEYSDAFKAEVIDSRNAYEDSSYVTDDGEDDDDEHHFEGDGCAVYDEGYVVHVDGVIDEDHAHAVEDLDPGDVYNDHALDPHNAWHEVDHVARMVNGDVHVKSHRVNYYDRPED